MLDSTTAKCGLGAGTTAASLYFDDFYYDDCLTCSCGEVEKKPDSTVTWIDHNVEDDGTITRVECEFPCITYYVDSVSGGGAETGSGTEEDPWTNLNTVFADSCIKSLCSSFCCPMVKVKVKGTIDYTVSGGYYNFERNLVIEPWTSERITVTITKEKSQSAIRYCAGCIWKNTDVNVTGTSTGVYSIDIHGFFGCPSSTFDTCNVTGTSINNGIGYSNGFGFYNCASSTFDTCNGAGTGTGTSPGYNIGNGFYNCGSSTFDTCNGAGTGSSTSTSPSICAGYGFFGCPSSTFDTCNGTGTGSSIVAGSLTRIGFYGCGSSFINCDGSGTTCGWKYNTRTVMSGNTCSAGCNTGAPDYCDDISDT
jgi:hypothetical protein